MQTGLPKKEPSRYAAAHNNNWTTIGITLLDILSGLLETSVSAFDLLRLSKRIRTALLHL